MDFVAYVAKDSIHGRACYVLECGGGLAQDVITTIGQAFELRFKEYLKRTPRTGAAVADSSLSPIALAAENCRDGLAGALSLPSSSANGAASSNLHHPPWSPDDPEYYNDLPGKVPPDVGPPPVPPLPNYQAPAGPTTTAVTATAVASLSSTTASSSAFSSSASSAATTTRKTTGRSRPVDLSDNLIDLNADVGSMGRPDAGGGAAAGLPPFADHEYVNGIMGSTASKDPFDMRNQVT